jgi:single-strand DNA-binding protein
MAVASGRLQLRDWTDKDGNKRRAAEVVADSVYFGDSKIATDNNVGDKKGAFAEIEEEDGDLPF